MTGLVVPVTMVVTFIAMKIARPELQPDDARRPGGGGRTRHRRQDRRRRKHRAAPRRGEGPLQATASALKELTVPLIGSTLTPIVVFLPLITITGVTGTFFSALAIAMSVSLLDVAGARAGLDEQPEHPPDPARQAASRIDDEIRRHGFVRARRSSEVL